MEWFSMRQVRRGAHVHPSEAEVSWEGGSLRGDTWAGRGPLLVDLAIERAAQGGLPADGYWVGAVASPEELAAAMVLSGRVPLSWAHVLAWSASNWGRLHLEDIQDALAAGEAVREVERWVANGFTGKD